MSKKALIVDDSELDRVSLQKILDQLGFETVLAVDGKEGIEKAKATRPSVIFMDVVMTDMNGFETTRIIVKETPETAGAIVILCTSKGQKTDQAWGRAQGAKAHIVKPATPENVAAALAEVGVK